MEKAIKEKKLVAIISIILATIFTTAGQLLWKFGVKGISDGAGAIAYINWPIFFGCVVYGLAAILMIIALKFSELSKIHPFLALGFVWVTLFAPIFLGEIISLTRISGIIVIIIGVIFIGR
jgi:drug/metabolite transporter (DMT)-like permease